MPIQFPDIQRINFDEANPWLMGAQRGQQFMQSAAQFPQDLQAKMLANQIAQVQAQYAQPMAQQSLQAAILQNQWNPKIWQSEIGLRGAQSGLAGAQSGLAQSETGMNLLKLNYLKQRVFGNQGGGMNGGANPASNSSALNIPTSGGQGQSGQAPGAPAQGGNQAMGQGGGQPAPSNSMYGIDLPSPSNNDIANSMLLGMDTFSPVRDNAKLQIQDQYKQYQKGLAESIQNANASIGMSQALAKFNDAMNRSSYKGARFGSLPSSGFSTAFIPGDLTAEQDADRSALQMLPEAISSLKDAMGTARFSNLDMNMATKMKFDRTMEDSTRNMMTSWVNGVNDRMKEYSQFLTTMSNPQMGATKQEADMLWSQYQNDFPLISSDGKSFQGGNLGNWPLFTTPRAIASIKATGTYSPTTSERNTFMMKYPDGSILPVKRGKVESAFRKGARPL